MGDWPHWLKVIVCSMLYNIASTASAIVLKIVSVDFQFPITVTVLKMLFFYVYCLVLLTFTEVSRPKGRRIQSRYWWCIVFPSATCHFFAVFFNYIAIWKITVSYTETAKATMPIFAVVLSWFVLDERHSTKAYLSLVPVILGVAVTTITESELNLPGLAAAVLCTFLFAVHNVFSKKCLADLGVSELQLLDSINKAGLLVALPLWLVIDGPKISAMELALVRRNVLTLLFIESLFNFAQIFLAYRLMMLLSQLSYAIANCVKRVFVVTASVVVMRNSISVLNACGIGIAIAGILYYSAVKHTETRRAVA